MANFDAAIAAQNVAIAAESLGLSMCYVGGARNNAEDLTKYLELPSRVIGLFGMAVGYANPAKANQAKPRPPLGGVVHMEKWNEQASRDGTAQYEKILQAHYDRHNKGDRMPWSRYLAKFVESDDLDGRERYCSTLDKQGFTFL